MTTDAARKKPRGDAEPLLLGNPLPPEDGSRQEQTAVRNLLPRVSIDAFATSPDVRDALTKAVADRRSARVQAQIRDGGFHEATHLYATVQPAQIIIVEYTDTTEALPMHIDALAELCPPSSRLLLIGSDNDVLLYRKLLRLGVSDYLMRPVTPLALIDTLAEILGDAEEQGTGHVLAYVGTRGGAGTSTIAQNVAFDLARTYNVPTLLIDCDIGFGTAALQFDISPPRTLDDAFKEGDALDKDVLEKMIHWRDRKFGIIAAPLRPDEALMPDREQIRKVIAEARKVASYVVVDLPHSWTSMNAEILALADSVTLIATPDLAGLRNTRTLLNMAKSLRPNDPLPMLVLNQHPTRGKGFITGQEFTTTLSCPVVAEIPKDPDALFAAQLAGKVLLEHAPKSAVSAQIRKLTAKAAINNTTGVTEATPKKGVLSRLLGRT